MIHNHTAFRQALIKWKLWIYHCHCADVIYGRKLNITMFKEYQNNFFKIIRRDRRTGNNAIVIAFIDFQIVVLYDQEKK
jgi:hypothetical protein